MLSRILRILAVTFMVGATLLIGAGESAAQPQPPASPTLPPSEGRTTARPATLVPQTSRPATPAMPNVPAIPTVTAAVATANPIADTSICTRVTLLLDGTASTSTSADAWKLATGAGVAGSNPRVDPCLHQVRYADPGETNESEFAWDPQRAKARLTRAIEEISARCSTCTYDLLGYSAGGTHAAYFLATADQNLISKVRSVTAVSSPLRGFPVDVSPVSLAGYGDPNWLLAGSEVMRAIERTPLPRHIRFTTVRSPHDQVVRYELATRDGAFDVTLDAGRDTCNGLDVLDATVPVVGAVLIAKQLVQECILRTHEAILKRATVSDLLRQVRTASSDASLVVRDRGVVSTGVSGRIPSESEISLGQEGRGLLGSALDLATPLAPLLVIIAAVALGAAAAWGQFTKPAGRDDAARRASEAAARQAAEEKTRQAAAAKRAAEEMERERQLAEARRAAEEVARRLAEAAVAAKRLAEEKARQVAEAARRAAEETARRIAEAAAAARRAAEERVRQMAAALAAAKRAAEQRAREIAEAVRRAAEAAQRAAAEKVRQAAAALAAAKRAAEDRLRQLAHAARGLFGWAR